MPCRKLEVYTGVSRESIRQYKKHGLHNRGFFRSLNGRRHPIHIVIRHLSLLCKFPNLELPEVRDMYQQEFGEPAVPRETLSKWRIKYFMNF